MHDRDRFDRFTERARKVLSLAQEEAQRFQHNYIGTEHLLLGLVQEGEGVGARVLIDLGADLARVRSAVEFIIGRGDRIVLGEVGLTPRSKKVIELAVDEARRLGHHYIGTEHLLLGLVREGEGIAAGVLESLGINLEKARQKTLQVLQAPGQDQGELSAATPARKPEHYEGFTAHARDVMGFAEEEARAFQRDYIGTEHLLLGLLREEESSAAHALHLLGVDYARVHRAIESILGHGDSPPDAEIGLAPRLNSVIALARDEARRMNHPYVGTEHLLLGLAREGQGPAVGILETMGIEMGRVHDQVIALINLKATIREAPHQTNLILDQITSLTEQNLRFNGQVIQVLILAHRRAESLQQTYIGTEHLLMGLIEGGGTRVTMKVLSDMGIAPDTLHKQVFSFIIPGSAPGAIPGLTPESKRTIKLAIDEARRMGHDYVGAEHLLLALIREERGIAGIVLKKEGATLERAREATIKALEET